MTHRLVCRLTLLFTAAVLVACATPTPTSSANSWSGRLAVQVDEQPASSFAAGFDLTGTPDSGELELTSPLGNTVATVRWAPGWAELVQGSQVTRRNSLDDLTTELAGIALPVKALFAWLRGQPLFAHGWEADLSEQATGRISARRTQPAPAAQLRLVFQP